MICSPIKVFRGGNAQYLYYNFTRHWQAAVISKALPPSNPAVVMRYCYMDCYTQVTSFLANTFDLCKDL